MSEKSQLKLTLHYSLANNSTNPEGKCRGLEDNQDEPAMILLTSYQGNRARVKIKIVKWDNPNDQIQCEITYSLSNQDDTHRNGENQKGYI